MSNVQENYMKKEFDEIVRLCEEAVPEYGKNASYFLEPATDEEITEWENKTNINIPESYKLWLKLTKGCQIRNTLAEFDFPEVEQPEFLPEDLVVVGEVIGDGEMVCFSKTDGRFITYFEGDINEEYDDFIGVLEETKRMLSKSRGRNKITEEKLKAMLAKCEELKKQKEENK